MKKAILTKGIVLLVVLGIHAFGQNIKTIEVNVKDKYWMQIEDTTLNPIICIDSLLDLYESSGVSTGPFFSDAQLTINLKKKIARLIKSERSYNILDGSVQEESIVNSKFEIAECIRNGNEYTFILKDRSTYFDNLKATTHYYFDLDKDVFIVYIKYDDGYMSISKPVELSMNSK